MSTGKPALLADFPLPSHDEWLSAVEKDLKGAPFEKRLVKKLYEGIGVQPLYTKSDKAEPVNASAGWLISQAVEEADPKAANLVLLNSLERGVTAPLLRIASPNHAGIVINSRADLETLLTGVYLEMTPLVLDAQGKTAIIMGYFHEIITARGLNPADVALYANTDPLAELAENAALELGLDESLEAFTTHMKISIAQRPQGKAIGVSALPWVDAGAHAAQELAIILSTGLTYLRTLEKAGVALPDAAAQMVLHLSVGTDQFLEIAKFRAARQLWESLLTHAGISGTACIHGHSADRQWTTYDPWVNMLRGTVGTFAAAVGGADLITTSPFDKQLGVPDQLGLRTARNTQIILQEESHLNSVADPASGCVYIEEMTATLAEQAWAFFQDIEKRGGIISVITDGSLIEEVAAIAEQRAIDSAKRKMPITGISEFPNLEEALPKRDQRQTPCPITDPKCTITPLQKRPFALEYETLRKASDAHQEKTGKRPQVFFANIGPLAVYNTRSTWCQNVLSAGGVESLAEHGYASGDAAAVGFSASGAKVAIVCSSDKCYAEQMEPILSALKQAGATKILVAGRPKPDQQEAWTAAGADTFLYLGSNILDILQDLHTQEGVSA